MKHGLEIFDKENDNVKNHRVFIWQHLLGGMRINKDDARAIYKCNRLASRICELRKMLDKNDLYKGWEIVTHQASPNSIASYELVRSESYEV